MAFKHPLAHASCPFNIAGFGEIGEIGVVDTILDRAHSSGRKAGFAHL